MTTETKKTPEEIAEERIAEASRTGATELDLTALGLDELPENLFHLTSLTQLSLTNNQLSVIPDAIGQLTALTILDLSRNQLTSLPNAIGHLTALTRLSLYENKLTDLPDTICQLEALLELYLADNQFSQIPDAIGNLRALRLLRINRNRITEISDVIGQLTSLIELRLSANLMTVVPDAICQLIELKELYISHGRLARLPNTIGQLLALNKLDLDSNHLSCLPDSIGDLVLLKELDITNNRLASLPESITKLTNLNRLYLHNNKQLGIPDEILGPTWEDVSDGKNPVDPRQILDYYFRTRRGERPIDEGRLILVGRGGAGKTSLVKRLVYDNFDRHEPQTDGIGITQWMVKCPAGDPVRLHLWDFGGQEIMHSLHRFFLSERALYLLVVTGREGSADQDVEYWMQHIATLGPGSPVIVVQNKCCSYPAELERRKLQGKYPQIRAFVETDCETEEGLERLKQTISAAVSGMDEVRKKFPAGWFGIKDALSDMAEPYISLDRFRKICVEYGEIEQQAQNDLAYFLHCLGIALHFPEERLRETSVLNPHWVTTGVYCILTSDVIRKNGGITDAAALADILPDSYNGMYDFLLELMRKFQLCLPFDDDRQYLIPELLPKDEPEDLPDFPADEGLGFNYHYTVLPEGVLPEFIVRAYVLIDGTLRWRNGVVLTWEGCRALVKADIYDGKVTIRITGGDANGRRRLLGVIRAYFDAINQGLKLKPEMYVPVPGHPSATPILYDDLCVFERDGIESIAHRIDGKAQILQVADLLGGVECVSAERRSGETPLTSPRIFISYTRKDRRFRDELLVHLECLKYEGIIDYWHDHMIEPGTAWDDRIKRELENAQIIIFLVSPFFLASRYIRTTEIPIAMAQQQAGSAVIVPVIVQKVSNYYKTELGVLQSVNDLKDPIGARTTFARRNDIWVTVAEAISAAAERFQTR